MDPVPALSSLLDLRAFPEFAALKPAPGKPVHVAGLAGSAASALVATQFRNGRDDDAPLLYLASDAKDAEAMAEDLEGWLGEDAVLRFPGLDLKPYEWREPFGQVREQRLEAFEALYKGRRAVVVSTVTALLERFQSPQSLHREIVTLRAGDALNPAAFREAAGALGFREDASVQDIGDFSVRGEILDIYPFMADNPYRIVLDGETIETIREFDIFTQRSLRTVNEVALLPQDECCYTPDEIAAGLLEHLDALGGETAYESELHRLTHKHDLAGIHWQKAFFKKLDHSFLDFLGPAARVTVVVGDTDGLAKVLEKHAVAARGGYEEARAQGRVVNTPDQLFFAAPALHALLESRRTILIGRIALNSAGSPGFALFDIDPQGREGAGLADVEPRFREWHAQGLRTFLLCPNAAQAERLAKAAEPYRRFGVEGVLIGTLASGFIDRSQGLALLTDHQLFNRVTRGARKRKFRGGGVAIPDFDALHRGDFVVHESYGIGRFAGIKRMRVGGREVDCILVDYQGKDKLTLPVSDLAKLEKFSGEEGSVPVLSKLGGKAWEAAKEKTRKAIILLVRELIELYARRSVATGHAFASDGAMQNEFEASFTWDLTPDQAKAIAEVKADMESPRPMDRLVCGDVGFGKTEVAMRAAFKAVSAHEGNRKQVALLAPTTILAAQHYETISERFADWPVRVESLHRFRTPSEQKETLAALASGQVDVIVGTHRLLSKDVKFKDLGLLIVDEEQKFGVKQKERLKELRAEVDVLALSATPIPRTLHFSLLGARDLSLIATPPRNRLPVETRVVFYDPEVIRAALDAELDRGGQAFFVHNRVQDIEEIAQRVRALVPRARVGVAHGQMEEGALERVMSAFVHREFDILVSTSIIESGIDISNANTLIVHRADLFGLSQLYQLRGRVGRSSAQAHCLLIAPDANKFSDDARRKLYALEKFTDLGSGFQIAMRDLEIRGAGNLLGLEQSGHIAAVGFETYCRMVRDATLEIQGGKPLAPLNPEIEFPADAFLPEDYVEDAAQRTTLYQKIARLPDAAAVDDMRAELDDRFGALPVEGRMLLLATASRIACRTLGVQKAEINENLLVLTFSEEHMPGHEELATRTARVKLPYRFVTSSGEPLQFTVTLNPPRRGDPVGLTEMAAEVLRLLAQPVS